MDDDDDNEDDDTTDLEEILDNKLKELQDSTKPEQLKEHEKYKSVLDALQQALEPGKYMGSLLHILEILEFQRGP